MSHNQLVKRPAQSEHNEQATLVDWVLYQYRGDPTFLRPLFFSVPNGAYLGGRSPVTFQKLKKEGFLQGVADLLYLQARGPYNFLALELKTEKRRGEKRGGLSENQVEFREAAESGGGLYSVCYGADEAIEVFRSYMLKDPAPIGGIIYRL